jgi:hypothetical protein
MRPVTDRFPAAISRSHNLAVQVEILDNGEPLGDPLTTVTAGTVTLDGRAQIRGRTDLTLTDDGSHGLVPTSPTDRLAPYGHEARVSRGIRYPDGLIDLVPLIVARIDSVEITDSSDSLTIQITGQDRSVIIADARFEEPYNIPADTNIATAILDLVQAAYPTVQTRFAVTELTTPKLIAEEQGDRWALCQKIATAAGMRLYFDGDGVLVLIPEAIGEPVVTLAEGEDGLLMQASRRMSRQGIYNVWVVTGENTGEAAVARAVVEDDNPLSPTYVNGSFGRVPKFFKSQFIRTDEQAQGAGEAMRARESGRTQGVRFGSLVLPHLEPGDVAQITRSRAGVNERNCIDQITIPLAADGVMSGATRATQEEEIAA